MTAATDPMAHHARQAALLMDGLGRDLLSASSRFALREERRDALERALTTWPKVCRAMAALEAVAPASAAVAAIEDGKLQDFMEARSGA